MRFSRLPVALAIAVTLAPTCLEAGGQSKKPTAPETISANAQAKGSAGAASTRITMKIERYSADADREAVVAALKQGYPEFLAALRKAPVVGTLTFAGQTFDIRWAREQPVANGRNITIVTDKPVYFVGGGVASKPREGFDVALLQFRLDDAGLGFDGKMAAAARLRSGGDAGVEIEDYGEKPIELISISRAIK